MSSAQVAEREPGCAILSFVEQSCYDKADNIKVDRKQVTFRLFSVGRNLGAKLDVTFNSDYGIYYGGDDEYLLDALAAAAPSVDWRAGKVFHRWLDKTRIQVLCESTGKVLAQIETRRYLGRKVRAGAIEAGEYGPQVLTMDQLRTKRMAAAVAKLKADRLARAPEDTEQ